MKDSDFNSYNDYNYTRDYEVPSPPGNGLAMTGMILGLVSIVLCLGPITAIPAVICSGIALSKINQGKATGQGMAIAGLVTGILGIVLVGIWLILAAMLLPALSKARAQARKVSCANNEKQIGLALFMYAEDYRGELPPYDGAKGLDLLRKKGYLTEGKIFVCPNTEHIPSAWNTPITETTCDYIYIGGKNLNKTDNPSFEPILWDKPENHDRFGNVLYLDGHVEGFTGANWMQNGGIK